MKGVSTQQAVISPAFSARFLGEVVHIGSLPAHVTPTESRRENCKALITGVLSSRRCSPALASSLAGKLLFLCSSFHSRVGISGIAPLFKREYENAHHLTAELKAGLRWLLQVLEQVGPRQWHCPPGWTGSWSLFGDAAEPEGVRDPRTCAAILQTPGGTKTQYFCVQVHPFAAGYLATPR